MKMFRVLSSSLRLRRPEINNALDAGNTDVFVPLGNVVALTGHDTTGSSTDGGTVTNNQRYNGTTPP